MHLPALPLALLPNVFGVDGLVILIIGLLIFGRRLPEVGKNLGKTIVEFKKGLSGVGEDSAPPDEPAPRDQRRLASRSDDRDRVSASAPSRRRLPDAENEEV